VELQRLIKVSTADLPLVCQSTEAGLLAVVAVAQERLEQMQLVIMVLERHRHRATVAMEWLAQ
jgi:hypothetical protein